MCGRSICFVFVIWVLSLALTGVTSATDLSLVLYLPFDEGAGEPKDFSMYNHGAELVNNPKWTEGRYGKALEFDGANYVRIPINDTLQLREIFTVEFWVLRKASQPATWNYMVAGGNLKWAVVFNANQNVYVWTRSGGTWGQRLVTTVPLTEDWTHIAMTYEVGSGVELYFNGEEKAGTGGSPPVVDELDDSIMVGARVPGSEFFAGTIDEVALYNRILSLGEIKRDMQGVSTEPWPYAYNPDPPDGALHADTWVTLSWQPGQLAGSHDVYLGDNHDDVSNPTPDSAVFRGNQTGTFFVAGFPGFAYPDGLVPGTTYYWRIDEVNDADPNSPWKGSVWSFSIPPKTAYDPNPADGVEFVDPNNVTLSWTPGFGAILHTVYFGDTFDEVSNATRGAPLGSATYKPGPLELEKVYYWRVDEFDAIETHKGDIWSFTTPGAVGNSQPAYKVIDVKLNAILSWTPADSATSHQLYFGTDKETVRTAGTSSTEYKGSMALSSESHDPGLLEPDTTYYWRVDEVDAEGNTLKGPIWIFTTGAFLLVEDFESYTDDDTAGQAIWQHWIDGFGVLDNGSQVGNLLPPYAEQTIVHGGSQSMPLLYVNEAGVTNSEATMTLSAPRDWTQADVAELSLWFRGSSGNAVEPLYVAVSNSAGAPAVVAYDDPAAAANRRWTEWRIPLQAFADQGINMTNVDKIAIGLGSTGGAAVGGSGTMFIDDIRLDMP